MVSKEQIRTEFDLFGRVWNVYKEFYIPEDNSEYWDKLVKAISEIQSDFPGQLSRDLSLSILADIERRHKGQQ